MKKSKKRRAVRMRCYYCRRPIVGCKKGEFAHAACCEKREKVLTEIHAKQAAKAIMGRYCSSQAEADKIAVVVRKA